MFQYPRVKTVLRQNTEAYAKPHNTRIETRMKSGRHTDIREHFPVCLFVTAVFVL